MTTLFGEASPASYGHRIGCTIDRHETDFGCSVTLGNPNTEAYEIMADIVVTVRRIVYRGLVKVSGDTWYLDGLAPGLFETLVARKETEIAIDRFDDEYQELISYATLDDLAETIEYNEDLAALLAWLGSDEKSIVERLREVESLRLKLAAFVPFTDDDLEAVIDFHQELGRMLKKRKDPAPEPEEVEPSETVEVKEESTKEIFGEDDGGDPESDAEADAEDADDDADESEEDMEEIFEEPGGDDPEDDAEDDPEDDPRDDVENDPEGDTDEDSEEEPDDEESEEIEEEVKIEEPVVDLSTQFAAIDQLTKSDVIEPEDFATIATELGTPDALQNAAGNDSEDALAVERAMASDDDREVLEILRREVMSVAESLLRNDPEEQHPVWETLRSSGWYLIKRRPLEIGPIEQFYVVADGVLEKRIAGHSSDEVKDFLEESEFSRLLLSLREMFLKHDL